MSHQYALQTPIICLPPQPPKGSLDPVFLVRMQALVVPPPGSDPVFDTAPVSKTALERFIRVLDRDKKGAIGLSDLHVYFEQLLLMELPPPTMSLFYETWQLCNPSKSYQIGLQSAFTPANVDVEVGEDVYSRYLQVVNLEQILAVRKRILPASTLASPPHSLKPHPPSSSSSSLSSLSASPASASASYVMTARYPRLRAFWLTLIRQVIPSRRDVFLSPSSSSGHSQNQHHQHQHLVPMKFARTSLSGTLSLHDAGVGGQEREGVSVSASFLSSTSTLPSNTQTVGNATPLDTKSGALSSFSRVPVALPPPPSLEEFWETLHGPNHIAAPTGVRNGRTTTSKQQRQQHLSTEFGPLSARITQAISATPRTTEPFSRVSTTAASASSSSSSSSSLSSSLTSLPVDSTRLVVEGELADALKQRWRDQRALLRAASSEGREFEASGALAASTSPYIGPSAALATGHARGDPLFAAAAAASSSLSASSQNPPSSPPLAYSGPPSEVRKLIGMPPPPLPEELAALGQSLQQQQQSSQQQQQSGSSNNTDMVQRRISAAAAAKLRHEYLSLARQRQHAAAIAAGLASAATTTATRAAKLGAGARSRDAVVAAPGVVRARITADGEVALHSVGGTADGAGSNIDGAVWQQPSQTSFNSDHGATVDFDAAWTHSPPLSSVSSSSSSSTPASLSLPTSSAHQQKGDAFPLCTFENQTAFYSLSKTVGNRGRRHHSATAALEKTPRSSSSSSSSSPASLGSAADISSVDANAVARARVASGLVSLLETHERASPRAEISLEILKPKDVAAILAASRAKRAASAASVDRMSNSGSLGVLGATADDRVKETYTDQSSRYDGACVDVHPERWLAGDFVSKFRPDSLQDLQRKAALSQSDIRQPYRPTKFDPRFARPSRTQYDLLDELEALRDGAAALRLGKASILVPANLLSRPPFLTSFPKHAKQLAAPPQNIAEVTALKERHKSAGEKGVTRTSTSSASFRATAAASSSLSPRKHAPGLSQQVQVS